MMRWSENPYGDLLSKKARDSLAMTSARLSLGARASFHMLAYSDRDEGLFC